MQLIDIRSTLIDIFPVDALDFMSLMTDSFSATIANQFGCGRLNMPTPSGNPGLVYSFGKIAIEGKTKIIDRIVIEERRIIVTIGGSSEDAKFLMSSIIALISKFETRHESRPLQSVIEIDEVQCTVHLKFNFERLFLGSVAYTIPDSLKSLAQVAPLSLKAEIVPFGLRFKIRYLGESEVLKSHSVSMADKYLSIEVREGTSLQSQVFLASAPVRSEILLKLLESLEREIG
ncbi:MAG: hypothetical protein BWX81_00005 [Spirochaetes bacterium ADurb.Bin110]|nr:MAG: hypothetical protein BWX81_00005 [Spirochaetes bacterium ADurb.Bin110]